MQNIRCWKCHETFQWDENIHTIGGKVVPEGTPKSDSLVIMCPLCATSMKIWVTNLMTYPVPIF